MARRAMYGGAMSANAQIGAAGLVRLGLADLGIVRTGRNGMVQIG